MSIYNAVRAFLRTCPLFNDERLNVDYLPETVGGYSLEFTPSESITAEYIDGTTIRQQLFTLSSREIYGDNITQNIVNLDFFESFAEWLEEQDNAGNLPNISVRRTTKRIEALTGGYIFDPTETTARYQIQCRLTYEQRKDELNA